MQLTVENLEGGGRCLHLSGRLDLKGTQEVDAQFTAEAAAMKTSVILNFSRVDYVASVGIRLLLSNAKALVPSGAKLIILKPQKMVEDILRMAGLDEVLAIEQDEAAARALLAGSAST